MLNPSFTTDISDIKSQSLLKNNTNYFNKINQEKLKEAAQEFESLLVYEMLKEMNKNISLNDNKEESSQENVFIKKNQAEKIFTDFLTYERGKMAVQNDTMNLGLADQIIKQLNQEKL